MEEQNEMSSYEIIFFVLCFLAVGISFLFTFVISSFLLRQFS